MAETVAVNEVLSTTIIVLLACVVRAVHAVAAAAVKGGPVQHFREIRQWTFRLEYSAAMKTYQRSRVKARARHNTNRGKIYVRICAINM